MRNTCLLVTLLAFSNCSNNYNSDRSSISPGDNEFKLLQDRSKEVIIHFSDRTVLARTVNLTNNNLTAELLMPDGHQEMNAYTRKEAMESPVHVYSNQASNPTGTLTRLQKSSITRISAHVNDMGPAIGSHLPGIIPITLILSVIVLITGAAMYAPFCRSFELDLGPGLL